MLRLALTYRDVLDDMASDHTLGLRAFELNDEEWDILCELACVLKVCINPHASARLAADLLLAGPEGRYLSLLTWHAQPRRGDSGDGLSQ